MKLFVTGGTGFVGSHFLNAAMSAGHDVMALRRPGSRTRIPLLQEPLWVDGLLDGDHRAVFEDASIDVFVHLASHTPNPPYDTFERCLYWNVWASMRLAEQACAAGVDRFIVAGSCFEYGAAADRYERIPTNAPLEAKLSYPVSKAAASQAFLGFGRQAGVRLQLMRLFQVYGEGEQASRFWPSLRDAALRGRDFPMSSGLQVRDFVAVEEVARQLIDALSFIGVEASVPVVHHIASGEACSLLDFARHWWAHWGATGRLLPGMTAARLGEVMRLVPETSQHFLE